MLIVKRFKERIKVLLPPSALTRWYVLQFLYRQRFGTVDISETPAFDADSTAYFVARLPEAKTYLEYGSGGSTILAARTGVDFTSIDSDPFFLRAVREKIDEKFPTEQGRFLYCDIGLTKLWGIPIFTRPTSRRRRRWRDYAEAPWKNSDGRFLPDLVLVDGRFRVACALVCIGHLSGRIDFEILVDDYASRPEFREIETFAQLSGMKGRMAVFKPRPALDRGALNRAIDKYCLDYR